MNEDGEERMMYFGPLSGKYGPIPIIYENEDQPDERIILSVDAHNNGKEIEYFEPNYKELVTGMKYIYNGFDWRIMIMSREIYLYLYELYGRPDNSKAFNSNSQYLLML